MSEFYNILRQLRITKGLMQKDVADALGISKSSYSLYESGKREPNLDMLEKIAEYFGVTIDYLIGINSEEIDKACDYALKVMANDQKETEQITIAAHFDGDEYTDEELEQIRQFAEFVKSKRKN